MQASGPCLLHVGCLGLAGKEACRLDAWQLLQNGQPASSGPSPRNDTLNVRDEHGRLLDFPEGAAHDSTVLPVIYLTAYAAYTAACVLYERRALAAEEARRLEEQANTAPEAQGPRGPRPRPGAKARSAEWDLAKVAVLFLVFLNHIGGASVELSQAQRSFYIMAMPFAMPTFAFVSGAFGTSVELSSMAKMLCYTFGARVLAQLAIFVIWLGIKAPKDLVVQADMVLWYLQCLAIWRLTLTPLFHASRQCGLPTALPFLAVFAGAYAWRHCPWAPPAVHPPLILTRELIFYAPFYAQGLLVPPSAWSRLLKDRRLHAAAVAFLVAWSGSLAGSAGFRAWNDVACALEKQCPSTHWPGSVSFTPNSLGWKSLWVDLRAYGILDVLLLAVMCLIAGVEPLLRCLAPRLLDVLAGCGTRTLYGYVLHDVFILNLGFRMGVCIPPMPAGLCVLVSALAAALGIFVWCCRLTERLFAWAVTPLWLLDCAAAVLAVCRARPSPQEGKAEAA